MGTMKLARRAMDDPERIRELEAAFDDRVNEMLAEANDAGYGRDEAMVALKKSSTTRRSSRKRTRTRQTIQTMTSAARRI